MDEGKVYRNKVKNRSTKMIKVVNEMSDLILSDDDKVKVEELRKRA